MRRFQLQPEMDLGRISVVTLDAGHTFLWPEYDILADAITQAFGQPVKAADVIRAERAFRRQNQVFVVETHPKVPIPHHAYIYYAALVGYCLGQKVEELGREFEDFAKYAHGYHLRKSWFTSLGADAVPALELLKTRYRLAVISNANGQLERDFRILGILDYFEVVADSAVVGFSKPDARIFRYALDRMCVKPEWAVHVGDHPTQDIQGAREAGMFALHYDAQGVYDDTPMDDVPTFRNLVDLTEALTRG